MKQKTKNPVWAFFASVQLALFLLCILAATSIIGTLIPQNQPMQSYVEVHGQQMANLLHVLDITDMYNSWWFLALLGLFSLNLIVCSLERIPRVIRIINRDNLDTSAEKLQKMGLRTTISLDTDRAEAEQQVTSLLQAKGWKVARRVGADGSSLLFSQKGAWTRFGVYLVHTSILVILLGAVIGSSTVAKRILHKPDFAFKGSIMIPETRASDHIYSFKDSEQIDLGFTVRCNYFNIEYYPGSRMPKTYLSKVTVLEGDREVLSTDIEVNTPLTYKGVTFYQSSYQPYQDYVVTVKNLATGVEKVEIAPPAEQIDWESGGASFGIINRETLGEVTQRVKVWFTDNEGEPSTFWVNVGQEALIERPSGNYSFSAKQLYATGLQVTKDPGVWLVYLGCMLMLLGLYIAFFMSHRKLYACISDDEPRQQVLFAGSANKNKVGFEKKFTELISGLQE